MLSFYFSFNWVRVLAYDLLGGPQWEVHRVARKFEEKVAKFQKTPKDLHQNNSETQNTYIKALSIGKIIYIKAQKTCVKAGFKLV